MRCRSGAHRVLAISHNIVQPNYANRRVSMFNFRKILLILVTTGLWLNPVLASVIASPVNHGEQSAEISETPTVSSDQQHCHSQPASKSTHDQSCCKSGKCDCSHACAVPAEFTAGATLRFDVALQNWINTRLHPASTVRFFRPPIV